MITESTKQDSPAIQLEKLHLINDLLGQISASELRDLASKLFYGYLTSENADFKEERTSLNHYHLVMLEFFTKMSSLEPKTNG